MSDKDYNTIKWYTVIALGVGFFLFLCGHARAQDFTDSQICDAIYWTEGDVRARQPYGIETIECKGEECRRICINTVRNNRKRASDSGEDFFSYLSRRYCPPNHKVWLKNVMWFLNNPKEVK